MNSTRLQHTIPGALVLILALVVAWLSFTQQPADSFLFPRVVSIAFVLLAIWNFIRATMGLAKVGQGISKKVIFNLLPGVIVIFIYIALAAKFLGFYSASFIGFFILYTLYDPNPYSDIKHWGKRIVVTAIFMTIIYLLFSMLLQVQTPRGLYF